MSVLSNEIEQFHEFAVSRAEVGDAESLQELLDLWYAEHPLDAELADSLASLNRGLADADAGRVRPAEEVIERIRREIGSDYELALR